MSKLSLDKAKRSRLEVIWVPLIISLWISLTSYALGLMKEPIGIPLTGALITLTLLAPLIYPRELPYYDSLIFSPLFVSYILLLNVVFSMPSIKLLFMGALYVLFSTLLLSAVVAWNIVSRLKVWELSVHLPIYFFITLTLVSDSWGISSSVYEFIWLLSLSIIVVKNFKTYFSGVMSLAFSLLVFLGLYHMLPDLTNIPHVSIGSATEFTYVYTSLLVSFTIASFINIISHNLVSKETVSLPVFIIRYFISTLTFVGLFYIAISVLLLSPFYGWLEYNLLSTFLVTLIISSTTATVAYLRIVSEKRKQLSSVLDVLRRDVESLEVVYGEISKTGLWSEETLEEIGNKLNLIKKRLEISKNVISRRLVYVGDLQAVSETLENTRRDLRELSEYIKSMYNHALNTYSKIVALISATPYIYRFGGEGSQGLESVERIDEIPRYIGSVTNLLREGCTIIKNLVMNTYVAVSEQLSTAPIEISKIEEINCVVSKSLLEDLYFMFDNYDKIINVALPKLRGLHSKLIHAKDLVATKIRELKKKPLEGLESPILLDKLYSELGEVPEIVSELEVLSYLRRYSILYNNLLTILDELINTLSADTERVGLKIRTIYGENIEIEDLLIGRMKRNIDLAKSKLSKDGIRSSANLLEGFESLLEELPAVLENIALVLERLSVLSNLLKHLTLFSDYVLQELAERKSININELPFTTEVSVQLVWIILINRKDIEVYENVISLKEGGG